MEALERRTEQAPALLDGLAAQARLFAQNIAMNMLQIGRVLTEAKPLMPHGQFLSWARENAGFSERWVQQAMAAWDRYGEKPQFAAIDTSKLFRMLALPEGSEDAFLQDHDVRSMSTREVGDAVKAVREELEAEKKARKAAEARAKELAERPPEIPEELTNSLREKDDEIARWQEETREVIKANRNLAAKAAEAERDLKEAEQMLAEKQEEFNRVQAELLDAKSAQARGDAERPVGERLTADAFASAVRVFLGSVGRVPFMGSTFAGMHTAEITDWQECVAQVEDWCRGAAKALRTVEGAMIDG